ncbi:unnamed protein product [Spirodela intermedia]|uniref:Bifunctional inhibitor/plant lipid transfer protein/seed storage helical domain-containing protein n=2 Tax=Spirodela intermedia TaxID=51605 RepID=A0A7I8JR21_SPIIN|nr:unnamed protein product [Spirodela intermedia]CAA6672610.1 unnamed protein product [Spirodela intermedia]CAA7409831.1 unnamed protein product [Spirodela intermedia]
MATAVLCVSFLLLVYSSFVSGGYSGGIIPPKEPTPWPSRKGFPARPPTKFPPANPFCPRDAVKLGACAGLLGVGGVVVGTPASKGACCAVLGGLAGAEVAACLCTVAKESVLGIVTEWTVAVSAVVSACKTKVPAGFKCL